MEQVSLPTSNYNTCQLSNGLRIIHLPSASQVVYCGYQIAAGTRHEEPGDEGLAHFCEHVTFKGTDKRSSLRILNSIEQVGGELNAFTNKEDTVFYAAVLKDHLARAVDVLTDIVFHSIYPQQEINKEIEVICDEIESYNDSPAELIYDDFENILFAGHPLGHNILGNAERLRQYTTADALRFTRKHYRPDNSIFFAYGDIDFKRLVRMLRKMWNVEQTVGAYGESQCGIDSRREECGVKSEIITKILDSYTKPLVPESISPSTLLPPPSSKTIIRHKDTHQAHVMLGTRAYDIHDKRRIALYLLNNILGGPGLNARLNLALRERNGLVYTVDSSMVSYGDTGLWCTYFGCDPEDVKRCLRLIRHELDKLMKKPLSATQLRMAKQQIKGQIGVACDNRESFALDFGKSFLHYGWEKDIRHLFADIDAVTAEQLQEVAQDIFDSSKITTLIYK
ncbi:MAG: insulinase family protein [Prevotella sp.]|nr:insulinase family protein [Prevotella sp.]